MTTKNKTTWRTVKLGEAVEIIDGDRGKNYPGSGELLASGYSIFLNTKNVSGTKFDFSNAQFISEERNRLLRKGELERGDFVLTTRGTIGNVAHYGKDIPYDHIRINSGMVVLRPKLNIIDVRFLNLFLVGQAFKNQTMSLQSGSAQPQLPIRDLQRFEIKLPPLTEQAKISDILWPFDEKIENNNRIIKTLEEMAQVIFKEWFVQFRFPGHKKTEFIDAGLGKIPMGWEAMSAKQLVKRLPQGKTYKPEELNQKGEVPVYDQSSGVILGYHNAEPALLATIDEPIAVFGDHTCRMKLIIQPFSLGPNVVPFVGNSYPTIFVYSLVNGNVTQREYKRHWSEFEQQEFVVPPPIIAEEYTDFIKPMVQKIVEAENENQKLAAMRDLLLPRLMSGEIQV